MAAGLPAPTRISIHAPREGSDDNRNLGPAILIRFQSTLPVRGATQGLCAIGTQRLSISIHAPREGSDVKV